MYESRWKETQKSLKEEQSKVRTLHWEMEQLQEVFQKKLEDTKLQYEEELKRKSEEIQGLLSQVSFWNT